MVNDLRNDLKTSSAGHFALEEQMMPRAASEPRSIFPATRPGAGSSPPFAPKPSNVLRAEIESTPGRL